MTCILLLNLLLKSDCILALRKSCAGAVFFHFSHLSTSLWKVGVRYCGLLNTEYRTEALLALPLLLALLPAAEVSDHLRRR